MWSFSYIGLASAVGPEMHRAAAAAPPPLDASMLFGFLVAVITLVTLIYRRELEMKYPAIAVCLAASGVYGFMLGDIVLGLILIGMSLSEFHRWRQRGEPKAQCLQTWIKKQKAASLYRCESRIDRMFGPAEA